MMSLENFFKVVFWRSREGRLGGHMSMSSTLEKKTRLGWLRRRLEAAQLRWWPWSQWKRGVSRFENIQSI